MPPSLVFLPFVLLFARHSLPARSASVMDEKLGRSGAFCERTSRSRWKMTWLRLDVWFASVVA
jgi:hypothetical protein